MPTNCLRTHFVRETVKVGNIGRRLAQNGKRTCAHTPFPVNRTPVHLKYLFRLKSKPGKSDETPPQMSKPEPSSNEDKRALLHRFRQKVQTSAAITWYTVPKGVLENQATPSQGRVYGHERFQIHSRRSEQTWRDKYCNSLKRRKSTNISITTLYYRQL